MWNSTGSHRGTDSNRVLGSLYPLSFSFKKAASYTGQFDRGEPYGKNVTKPNGVMVSQARIDALLQLLSYLAVGDFEAEKIRLVPAEPEDPFSTVEAARAAEITEKLLQRITDTKSKYVIIDVTGVDAIDAENSARFVRMVRAAELLGAHCVVTGLRPQIVQTLVDSGADLGGVTTLATLKDGLKYCLRSLHS